MLIPNSVSINNIDMEIYHLQGLKSSFIPYMENQLGKPNSWDCTVLLISLFGTDEFVMIDFNNISTLLFKMANFIRSKVFLGHTEKNISAIVGFGQVAWNFILSIYKLGWNNLKTNNNNRLL